ncbi:thymidylate kinase [Anaeramoeba ignava]|uniref:Thymidylate kinase n=1 Tax=Anaeramoeba ignava TaxID=1746090 RepID=A0A9Q0RCS2_ANAIG|nr:thymidylate kinase [Anaeramoeba ignava]
MEIKLKKRGLFIVIEGIDRSGKSTQCQKIYEYLIKKNEKIEQWKYPDRNGDIGKLIDNYLKNQSEKSDQAIHLLFSADRWEKNKLLQNKLESGINIVCDRYAFSGVAYSSAKGLDLEWCKSTDSGLISPDVVIYLDLDPKEAQNRSSYGEERYEKLTFQSQVSKQFDKLKDDLWKVIDSNNNNVESTFKEIQIKIDELLKKREEEKDLEIKKLWIKKD